jgi:hypothetical protein
MILPIPDLDSLALSPPVRRAVRIYFQEFSEELNEQARLLLLCGFKPQELCYVIRTDPPKAEVLPLICIQPPGPAFGS